MQFKTKTIGLDDELEPALVEKIILHQISQLGLLGAMVDNHVGLKILSLLMALVTELYTKRPGLLPRFLELSGELMDQADSSVNIFVLQNSIDDPHVRGFFSRMNEVAVGSFSPFGKQGPDEKKDSLETLIRTLLM